MNKVWAILWAVQGMYAMYVYSVPFSRDGWWNGLVQALIIAYIIFDAIMVYANLRCDINEQRQT